MIIHKKVSFKLVLAFIDLMEEHNLVLPRLPRATVTIYNSIKIDSQLTRSQYLFLLDTFPGRAPEEAFTDISFFLRKISEHSKRSTTVRLPTALDLNTADKTDIGSTQMRETLMFVPPGVTASQLRAAIAMGTIVWGRHGDDEAF